MKEWILKNTNISEEQYNSVFNLNTVMISGNSKEPENDGISDHPIVNISMFTFDYPNFSRRKKHKIKRIKDINKKHLYTYQNIKFYILGEYLKKYTYITFSTQRLRNCFYLNSMICLLPNINTFLITAMCENPFRKSRLKYIHTFVLLKNTDGKDYILDGTTNTIMDKKTYFDIFKPKVITCISKDKLEKDLELLKPFEKEKYIYRAEYLCFPKQTIKAAKKFSRKR